MRNLSPTDERPPQGLRTHIHTLTVSAFSSASGAKLSLHAFLAISPVQNSPNSPPPQQHFRDKIRPAPRKWPVFRDFGPAGRVLSRLEVRRWIAERIFALNNGGRTITPGPVVVVPGKQQAPENSHVIRLKEVSTNAENVAIPTRRIQDLKQSQGNYVRNW